MKKHMEKGDVVVIPSCIEGIFRGGIIKGIADFADVSIITEDVEIYGKSNVTAVESKTITYAEDDIQKCRVGDVAIYGYEETKVGGIIAVKYQPKTTRYEYTVVTKNAIWSSVSDYIIKEVKRIPYDIFVDCMIDEEKYNEYIK